MKVIWLITFLCMNLVYMKPIVAYRGNFAGGMWCRRSFSQVQSFTGYTQPLTKSGAYDIAHQNHTKLPVIILVNPFLDQNVGSVARIMLNFGFTELRVVNPVCDIYSDDARALSSGAQDIITNAKVFGSLEECVKDLSRVMATTDRPRYMTQMVYSPKKAAEQAVATVDRVGIMFGRERSGLTNEELAVADSIITVPTYPHFTSLNLAQAVNLICYEVWTEYTQGINTRPPDVWLQARDGERLGRREELDAFFKRLEEKLSTNSFQSDEYRRELAFRHLRNVFQRVLMTKSEIDLMHGVLSCLTKQSPPSSSEI